MRLPCVYHHPSVNTPFRVLVILLFCYFSRQAHVDTKSVCTGLLSTACIFSAVVVVIIVVTVANIDDDDNDNDVGALVSLPPSLRLSRDRVGM